MSIVRRLGVAAVVVALVTTLFAGNVVIAAHQTVLDPGYVTDTLDEENAYEAIHEEVISNGSLPVGDSGSLPPFASDLAGEIVTPSYIQSQAEANIERTYGYLHGSRDSFVIVLNTEPVKNRTDDAVAAAVRNVSARELAEFAGFESGSLDGVPVNTSTLFQMSEGPESFAESRQTVRSVARDRLLTRLVDSQFQRASNDELLRLVIEDYNESEYTEEEKEQLVADRESEIRSALRERIETNRGSQINETVTTLLNQSRSDLKSQYATFDTGFGEEVDAAAGDMVGVYIDGLLAPNVTYGEFSAELNATKADLGAAIGDVAQERLDERVPDQLALSNQLGTDARKNVVRARAGVVVMDVLGWFLPLLALVLAGLIWVISDAVETAALWSGVSALVAGAPGYLATTLFGSRVTRTIQSQFPEGQSGLAEVAVGLVSGTLSTLSAQSLLLVVVGALLTIAGAVVRLGLVDLPGSDDSPDRPGSATGVDPEPEPASEASSGTDSEPGAGTGAPSTGMDESVDESSVTDSGAAAPTGEGDESDSSVTAEDESDSSVAAGDGAESDSTVTADDDDPL